MRFLLAALVAFTLSTIEGQEKYLMRELMVENDNDAYTFNLTRDSYYSNGVALRYRQVRDTSETKKVIRSFDLNHRIFTPRRLWWTELQQLDRPYAGQVSVSISDEFYYKKEAYLKIKGELGWMGPATQTDRLQYHWHKTFGMQLPLAWQHQINDGPIINTYATYVKTIAPNSGFDIASESNLALGNTFSHLRQELIFRVGKFKPIDQSTQLNGIPGIKYEGPGLQEFYFFISPGVEYVAYNATIEGNPLGKSSAYVEERVPWIYQTRAGIMASWTKFDFALFYYRRTKETTEAFFHKYVGIRMNQRF
ncbi:MAG: lipid A deacylase LpxR family protein [Bacteroidota bacterium]